MSAFRNSHGGFQCSLCFRPFDEDPAITRLNQLNARLEKLRGITDDEEAARAFYYHRYYRDLEDRTRRVFCGPHQLAVPGVAKWKISHIEVSVEPGAEESAVMENVDAHVLPSIRYMILSHLNGTAALEFERAMEEIKRQNATGDGLQPNAPLPDDRCPAYMLERPIGELYPHGYTRHADGSVDPNPPPEPNERTPAPQ
jgi:hypothetical protein